MILWNPTFESIESKYDGKVYTFQADERKRIFEPWIYNHLMMKLQEKGLVLLPDEGITDDMIKTKRIDGLKARRKMHDRIVQNFTTLNKEREASKMSSERPSVAVINAVRNIKKINNVLDKISEKDFMEVEEYVGQNREKWAEDEIKTIDSRVEVDNLTGAPSIKTGKGDVILSDDASSFKSAPVDGGQRETPESTGGTIPLPEPTGSGANHKTSDLPPQEGKETPEKEPKRDSKGRFIKQPA